GEVGAVDHDLVSGEEYERGTGGAVLGHEAAVGDVVAGGVLDAGEHSVGAEPGEHVPVELDVDAHGQVVCEDRQVRRRGDRPEVRLDLLGPGDRIERRGRDDAVGPDLLGPADV